jgi:hypothetical protein
MDIAGVLHVGHLPGKVQQVLHPFVHPTKARRAIASGRGRSHVAARRDHSDAEYSQPAPAKDLLDEDLNGGSEGHEMTESVTGVDWSTGAETRRSRRPVNWAATPHGKGSREVTRSTGGGD